MTDYTCPICDSLDIEIFIEIPQIPVYCNLLYKTRQEALNAPRADMKLGFCKNCGHVYNYVFNSDIMDYTQDYENSLHFSPRFQKYAEKLAHSLVERYNLYNKDIIEIGCGDGDFLELLCRFGSNRGLGFDPSHVPDLDITDAEKRIAFIRDYYSDKYSHYKADLVCCRHVLEHIQHPCDFIDAIRSAVGKRSSTVVFFEVPNVLYTLKDLGIWDLIYEHCSYFSLPSLRAVFNTSGFEILNETEAFQGQFLCIETRPSEDIHSIKPDECGTLTDLKNYISRFEEKFTSKVTQWNDELKRMQKVDKTAVVWGAGSKGATFLNSLKIKNQIKYVVDINPRKKGKFVAGTGQEIISPNSLIEYRPDKVVIMNSIYTEEIHKMLKEIRLSPELIAV
jgi:hypothetical protein